MKQYCKIVLRVLLSLLIVPSFLSCDQEDEESSTPFYISLSEPVNTTYITDSSAPYQNTLLCAKGNSIVIGRNDYGTATTNTENLGSVEN